MGKKKVVNKKIVEVVKPTKTEEVKIKPIEEVVEETIFSKYRHHIDTAKEGYLKKITYGEAIDMLRYIQKNTNHKLGLNMSCSNCLIELVQIFSSLEK